MSDSNFTLLVICGGVTDQERQRRIEEIQWYAANNELISSTHVRWLLDQLAAALADRERLRELCEVAGVPKLLIDGTVAVETPTEAEYKWALEQCAALEATKQEGDDDGRKSV